MKTIFVSIIVFLSISSCSKSGSSSPTPSTVKIPELNSITAISNITAVSAVGGGNISSDGGAPVISRGVCWSTAPAPTITNSKTVNGTGTGLFASNLTGLTPETLYYVRAYASNNAGTAYSAELSFTTPKLEIPTLSATLATGYMTMNTVVSGGTVTSDGWANVTARGVCWSNSPNPTIANSKTTDGTGKGVFTSNLTGLLANTVYYARSYATNSVGTGYGTQINFTSSQIGTAAICSKVWMDKNLSVNVYRNGDPIPLVTDSIAWSLLTTGAYCYYKNDPATEAVYGKLYNWYAVNDPRGLAPAGWHVASLTEWQDLITCLGGVYLAGGPLKETGTARWHAPNVGATNSSGFTALPGGYRVDYKGLYYPYIDENGFWWASSEFDAIEAYDAGAHWGNTNMSLLRAPKAYGFYVRCIKD